MSETLAEPVALVELTASEVAFTVAVLQIAALFHPPSSPWQEKTVDVVTKLEMAELGRLEE